MGKKNKADKNNLPDPATLVVEPTIQYMGGKNTDGKTASLLKKFGRS